jgi:hypothetical protein
VCLVVYPSIRGTRSRMILAWAKYFSNFFSSNWRVGKLRVWSTARQTRKIQTIFILKVIVIEMALYYRTVVVFVTLVCYRYPDCHWFTISIIITQSIEWIHLFKSTLILPPVCSLEFGHCLNVCPYLSHMSSALIFVVKNQNIKMWSSWKLWSCRLSNRLIHTTAV